MSDCWYCRGARGGSGRADQTIRLRRQLSSKGMRITYEVREVVIPRCSACASAQPRAVALLLIVGLVVLALGIAASWGVYVVTGDSGLALAAGIVFVVATIVVRLIRLRREPQARVEGPWSYVEHPEVRALMDAGFEGF
jgi:protein-S-isoprenylcysteine O-methyltransferase Ste14